MPYSAETYPEAVNAFQRDFARRMHTVLVRSGWKLPEQWKIKLMEEKKGHDQRWGDGYFHIDFVNIIPQRVIYNPVNTVTLERTPDVGAERIYTNNTDVENKHIYTIQKDESHRRLHGTTNMQGLEISNKTTVGTGEGASVKVENETEVKVSAQFEQSRESEVTKTNSEIDTAEIPVLPHTRTRVTQTKFKTKMQQTDEVTLICDIAFEVYAHRKWIPHGLHHNKEYRHVGKNARRVLSFNSVSDLRAIFKGISPHHPEMRKDWISADKVIASNIEALRSLAQFKKIEESTFEEASYGEVIATSIDKDGNEINLNLS